MKLTNLKGIKEKREKLLNSMDIYTVTDMLNYFPSKYIDLSLYENSEEEDSPRLLKAEVTAVKKGYRKGAVTAKAECGGKSINMVWFNQPYVFSKLQKGSEYVFFGKSMYENGVTTLYNPVFEPLGSIKKLKGVIPVYRLCEGLPQGVFSEAVGDLIGKSEMKSLIPLNLIQKYRLDDIYNSYKAVHRPQSVQDAEKACRRIAAETVFSRLINIYLQGNTKRQRSIYYNKDKTALDAFFGAIDFEFTEGQKKCLNEIIDDLKSGTVMNRLLQGDVGSGKSAVAFAAMYFAVICGGQCLYAAPTEILARQQYIGAVKIFDRLGIKADYLSGSLSKEQKDRVLFNIKNNACSILFATHSVLSDEAEFADLRLTVCDEQHRFGVKQRGLMKNKGKETDMLIMSATPLPRTLNIAVYGELSVSRLEDRPKGKADTFTHIVPESKIDDMYNFVRKLISEGRQVYIVARSIESDGTDNDSVKKLYKELTAKNLSGISAAFLHGAMKEEEKKTVMNDFAEGRTSVLISTTIIEVGIDVGNAAAIIIYGADKFGLAQLHQLRGRVGRGTHKSYCFLLYKNINGQGVERLSALKNCNDGFELAEIDLKMRGTGEFLGFRQHGGYAKGENAVKEDEKAVMLALNIYNDAIRDECYIKSLKSGYGISGNGNVILN